MGERRPGEEILEFIARSVSEMRQELREHARDDAERHSEFLVSHTRGEERGKDHERRLVSLEEVAEVTGVHNVDELRGKYFDTKRELEKVRATRDRWILAAASGVGGLLLALVSHKLIGWP
jgi:predicted transcriptional regulator